MANPQKENGYTPIANELLDAIVAFRIPGELRQVFDAIMRKTYGFNKKRDVISVAQIVTMSGLDRQNVWRSMKKLVEHRLVVKVDYTEGKGNILEINKDYSRWIPFVVKSDYSKKVSSELTTAVVKADYKVSSRLMHTKDKRHIKDIRAAGEEIGDARMVRDIIEAFTLINPAMKKSYGNTVQRQACLDLVKEYTFERVLFVVEHTLPKTNNIAFLPTILTPHQLFHDWARLESGIKKYKSKVDIKNQEKGRGLA